jgi:hypothetical protein
MARKKFTTTMDEDIIKKLKKLAVDHDTDAGRMIEKLVKDNLIKCRTCERGIDPLFHPNSYA